VSSSDGYGDGFDDDDDYVEYTLPRASVAAPRPSRTTAPPARRVDAPDESRRPTPEESWRSQLEDMTTTTEIEPIGYGGSGFDDDPRPRAQEYPPLDQRREPEEPFLDDIDTYGGSTSHDSRRNGYRQPPPERRRHADPEW
jgi:hypothetical protein